jgi:mannosyl-3-phosphoglycerate phosphatase family protein
MNTPNKQMLVFTGLDGDMIASGAEGLQTILPALELLHSREIPHIATTERSAAEIIPLLEALDHHDPFVVEAGAAIYIPANLFKIKFSYQKTVGDYRVVELGALAQDIREKVAILRRDYGLEITGLSELKPEAAAGIVGLSAEDFQILKNRQYSEPIIYDGAAEDLPRLHDAAEELRLRLVRQERMFVLTGDHDEGSAVSFLMQLYREEYPGMNIASIGLGDNASNIPMLYTVDTPVLVRLPGGRFDDRVGRRGMKFTREPGPLGWNQAIIALVTEDPEA